MPEIFREYENLEMLSRNARYDDLDMEHLRDADLTKIERVLDNMFLPL
ncbi:MAG: hypothetical protein V3U52_00480 [Thermoplasmata archaeon]